MVFFCIEVWQKHEGESKSNQIKGVEFSLKEDESFDSSTRNERYEMGTFDPYPISWTTHERMFTKWVLDAIWPHVRVNNVSITFLFSH